MRTPEKIYLQVCGDCPQTDCKDCKFEDLEDNVTWCVDRIFPKDVEYTRTDAFIEKARNYLNDRLLNYIEYCRRGVGVSTEEFIEEFLKTIRQ